MGKKKKSKLTAKNADLHVLYEASVQAVEHNLIFMDGVFRKRHGRKPVSLKEDFCGTARMAAEWVEWDPTHTAWGVDLDEETLDWGKENHRSRLGDAAERLTLLQEDVLTAATPPVDMVCAFNFSYWIFKNRELLRSYFAKALDCLSPGGILALDIFGGTNATQHNVERSKERGKRDHLGRKIPAFTYVWEETLYNAVNHDILCHIHFEFKDGTKLKRAFTYDWRMWTIPEIFELLKEAGFSEVEFYTHGWDTDGSSNDAYRKVTRFENEPAWLGYIVGIK